jgi:hypothetical protein
MLRYKDHLTCLVDLSGGGSVGGVISVLKFL